MNWNSADWRAEALLEVELDLGKRLVAERGCI